MKNALFTLLIFVITGCTSSQHANESSIRGLTTTQLGEDKYELHYQTRHSSKHKALELTMQQAAKLTLDKGYDWFSVIEKTVEINQTQRSLHNGSRHTEQTTRCGLLSCTSQTTHTGYEPAFAELTVTTHLTITLGKGIKPNGGVYDAQALGLELNNESFKNQMQIQVVNIE